MNTKLVVHLLVIEIFKFAAGWTMQLCIKGSTVTIVEKDCPYGLWLSQPWEISTACFDGGIWAVYKDWCQERPFIWTVHPSTRGCMRHSILRQVIGIVYLGPQETGAAMSTKKHKLFLTTNNYQMNDSRVNLNDTEVDILIWGKAQFNAHALSTNGDDLHKCLLKGRHTYSASYNFPLKIRQNILLKVDQVSCLSQNSHRWDSNQLLPTHLDSEVMISSASESHNFEFHCTTRNNTFNPKTRSKTFKRNIENINYMAYSRSKDLLTTVSTERLNEQTERLARKLIAHVFIEEPLPAMDFAEWKFLLIAQEIFETSCPSDLVPKEFFEHILIFYRFLLIESFDKFPPNIDKDEESRFRIEMNLQKCLTQARPIPFKDYSNCSTGSEPLIAEYTHVNGTTEDIVVQIPAKIKLDAENFDVILESIWKLMIFIHYFCAEHFKENPQDLSTLHHRWQESMAVDLLTRWQCPGKSYLMVSKLVRNVDFARSLRHLDHCVAGSHMYSPYSGWVKRPVPLQANVKKTPTSGRGIPLEKAEKKRKPAFNFYTSPMGSTFPEEEWDGVVHCMSDYNYPARVLGYSMDKCGVE